MESTFERENAVLTRLAERTNVDVSQAAVKLRRIYLSVPEEIFMDALKSLRDEQEFDHLCAITGLDTGESFEFLYHVAEPGGIVFTLKFKTRREDPVVIQTVLPLYNGATFYERELEGLLGVKVEGLTPGRQYPLPDNWPKGQYPMRKDWKPGDLQKTVPEPAGAPCKLPDPSKGV
jgi:NADH:ubiquinone oxidoreductase subunit C